MSVIVTGETAGICSPRIGDWECSVRRDDLDVKVDEPLSGNGPARAAHPMRGMAGRARKSVVHVPGVFAETAIGCDFFQVMALSAERIGAIATQIWNWEEVGDELPGPRGLAEFVTALKDVSPFRAVRTVRPQTAKLAVVIAVVAIGAENLSPHAPPLCDAVEIQHVRQQAGLQQPAAAHMGDGVAGGTAESELGDDVERVARGNCTRGEIP